MLGELHRQRSLEGGRRVGDLHGETRISPPLCWAAYPKPEQSLHPFDVAVAAATPELGVEIDGVHVEAARPRSPLNIVDIPQLTRPYDLVLIQQDWNPGLVAGSGFRHFASHRAAQHQH